MTLGTLGREGQITVPKEVRDVLHLAMGDQVLFVVDDGHVTLYPMPRRNLMSLRGLAQGRRPFPGREAERSAAYAQAAREAHVAADE
jgi:AbrB family looped-hinge helix DNA binding protein